MAKKRNRTDGSVTATGVICTIDMDAYDHLGTLVGGTFVGTVAVQVSNDGVTWVALGAAVTAPATTVQLDCPFKFARLNCTAYTSGTIVGQLGAKAAS